MADPTPQEETETVLGALIAVLLQKGLLDVVDIEGIARRVHLAGMPDMAEEVRGIPLAEALSEPGPRLVHDDGA